MSELDGPHDQTEVGCPVQPRTDLHLPDGLDDLGHIAGHAPNPILQNVAFDCLRPCIEGIARSLEPSFRKTPAAHVVGAAPGVMWERRSGYQRERGSYPGWCRTVLYHWALDEIDRYGDPGAPPDRPDPAPSPETTAEIADELVNLLRRLRTKLVAIAWEAKRDISYFAVLLVQLRLSIARRLSDLEVREDGDRVTLIEGCLPWRADEEQYQIRTNWPSIGEIWRSLADKLRSPPNFVDGAELCEQISELLENQPALKPDLWNHWVNRAKDETRQRVNDEAVWDELFSTLLPDHARRKCSRRKNEET